MGAAPSLVLPGYWQGGDNTYRGDPAFFTNNGVSVILSVCDTPAPSSMTISREVSNLFLNLEDKEDTQLYPHFTRVCEFLHSARCTGKGVYVHCGTGVSSSTTMTCAYLMAHLGLTLEEALSNVRRARKEACPNDGFREQLARWHSSGDAARVGLRYINYVKLWVLHVNNVNYVKDRGGPVIYMGP